MLKYSHIFRYSDDNNRRINPALQGGTKRQPGVQGPGPRGPPLGPLLGARPQGGHGQTQARQRPRDGEVVRGLQGQPLHQQCGTYWYRFSQWIKYLIFILLQIHVYHVSVPGNYTCVSDTHTATVLLVITIREAADTGPEGLKTVNKSYCDKPRYQILVIILAFQCLVTMI